MLRLLSESELRVKDAQQNHRCDIGLTQHHSTAIYENVGQCLHHPAITMGVTKL